MLIDWEDATSAGSPFQDPFHWIVQAHTFLGRPGGQAVIGGIAGKGWIGEALDAYAAAAGLERVNRNAAFRTFLERTIAQLDAAGPHHQREAAARRALLAASAGRGASSRSAGAR